MDYIIVANGNFLVREIIAQTITDKVIVALDGAANKLARLGFKPHIILGDFDSINIDILPLVDIEPPSEPYGTSFRSREDVIIVPSQDQSLTDLTKAIHYCDQHGATSITLICAVGARLDHHEGVTRSLYKEYQANRPILLHTEQQTLRLLRNEAFSFNGNIGDKFGVVAFPEATISSQGLKYELNQFPLKFGLSESICNELREEVVHLSVSGNALIMMPPQLSSQREFIEKSETERLLLLLRDLNDIR